MSEALSASATFQALQAQVATKAPTASPTFTGTTMIGDANFQIVLETGNPTIRFNGGPGFGDGIVYVRSSSAYLFYIGNVLMMTLDSSGNLKTKGTITQNAL